MPRGRRPLPTALRKLLGNPGKRALNEHEPKPAPGEPEMPWLAREAAAEWRRVVPILLSLGILTIADGPALALYCAAYGHWQCAERELTKCRDLSADKARKLNRMADSSMKLAKSMLVEFGLTPASRPRLASFCILPAT
jgi:P27 family predicted phage terminase small subunit